MSVFQTYLQLGFFHIFNLQAYDHLVFLLALCAPFVLRDWRRVVALVTSFTLGHSLTLALATLGLVTFPAAVIEALIPVTILLTCAANLRRAGHVPRPTDPVLWTLPNALAAGFGLVHGLGFSNYLRELLGQQSRPVLELLAFNVGVEIGQLLIVGLILLLGLVVLRVGGAGRRDWVLVVSGAAAGIAVMLLLGQHAGA
ncbi:HupE/UreJ family protein [Hymenobacter coalescens]